MSEKMFNVELRVVITKDDGESPPKDRRVFKSLTMAELNKLEAKLINVLKKLNKFSDDREKGVELPAKPDNTNKGTVNFLFKATKTDGSPFAHQTNEWVGMGGREIEFMLGMFEGELASLDKKTKEKCEKK